MHGATMKVSLSKVWYQILCESFEICEKKGGRTSYRPLSKIWLSTSLSIGALLAFCENTVSYREGALAGQRVGHYSREVRPSGNVWNSGKLIVFTLLVCLLKYCTSYWPMKMTVFDLDRVAGVNCLRATLWQNRGCVFH